jgi:hypothetical protein
MTETPEPQRSANTVLLRTYRRDGTPAPGTPVPTPVGIAFDGDRAFFSCYATAWAPAP